MTAGANNQASEERRPEHETRLAAWRAENRKAQDLGMPMPLLTPSWKPATQAAAPLAAPPVAPRLPAPPSFADLEFERVRSAALARIEAKHDAQRAEDAVVALILGAS